MAWRFFVTEHLCILVLAGQKKQALSLQEATRRIREAIRQRYVLLPYIYTLFRHANISGTPVMRPLWFDFPEEAAAFAVDDEFMLGPGLLVSPCCWHLSVD
jgi:alpha-glucosidase (family GH31 glycosyl hydrolase)